MVHAIMAILQMWKGGIQPTGVVSPSAPPPNIIIIKKPRIFGFLWIKKNKKNSKIYIMKPFFNAVFNADFEYVFIFFLSYLEL